MYLLLKQTTKGVVQHPYISLEEISSNLVMTGVKGCIVPQFPKSVGLPESYGLSILGSVVLPDNGN